MTHNPADLERIESLMQRAVELYGQRHDAMVELEALLKNAGLARYEGAGYSVRFQQMVKRDGTPTIPKLVVMECL